MIAQQEKGVPFHDSFLLEDETKYVYSIAHPHFKDSVAYVEGRIPPNLIPLVIGYIQSQMKEVQREITLFPKELERILINVYGFEPSYSMEELIEVKLDEIQERFSNSEDALLLLPFYRKGLFQELQRVSQKILNHYNS